MTEQIELPERTELATPLSTIIDSSKSDFHQFRELITAGDSIAVLCHDNPDPDTLASALALARMAEEWGVPNITIAYGGTISHQQNRAMINALDIDLTRIDECSLTNFDTVAFVDHSISGRNNSAPKHLIPDIVIDHHPSDSVKGQYVDHRPEVGATATILIRYLQAFEIEIEERLATALLFGLHRETLNFTRGTTAAEHAAACYLHPTADHSLIETLSNSMFTGETIDGIEKAIANREIRGSCLVSSLGRIHERDILPQAADYLLRLEGVSTTIVFAVIDDNIQLSARSTNSNLHLGDLLSETFDEDGSAGGHHEMAGGQVPLGIFGSMGGGDDMVIDLVNQSMTKRLFDALDSWAES